MIQSYKVAAELFVYQIDQKHNLTIRMTTSLTIHSSLFGDREMMPVDDDDE